MTIEPGQSVEFQSYQGLQRVVRSSTGIYEPLNTLIEWLRLIQYRSFDPTTNETRAGIYEYKRSVRLLDTFLIGSMREDTLQKLVRDSIEYKFPIQILILDPYSPLAQLRAMKISSEESGIEEQGNQDSKNSAIFNAIGKVNLSLFNLLKAAREVEQIGNPRLSRVKIPDIIDNPTSIDFLEKQLQMIRMLKAKDLVDVEVKFYTEQTEVPVYIISRFVAKGLVFPNFQASRNPWLIFVDDRTQSDDIYDNFSNAFDDIWENESSLNPKRISLSFDEFKLSDEASRRVFIVHGRDDGAKDTVARFLEVLRLEPVILAEQTSEGKTVVEKFEKHANVGFAIILLTPDDIGYLKDRPVDKKPRARQNVMVELGYFMDKLSRKRVCALSKGDIEIPSDYHGVLREDMDERGAWKLKLAREMKSAGLTVDLNQLQ
jgi:Predicted nucleotide-binding protein containing TIR-like domain